MTYAGFFFIGMVTAVLGPILPSPTRQRSLTDAQSGLFFFVSVRSQPCRGQRLELLAATLGIVGLRLLESRKILPFSEIHIVGRF